MSGQQVRTSQFVTTYGPGAILEGEVTRIIPRPDIGMRGLLNDIETYEIDFRRMSAGLLGGGRIFRLPSNAQLGRSDDDPVYRTRTFPYWHLCWNRDGHAGNVVVLYGGTKCPACHSTRREDREAVRFVQACPAGHLDDVDWASLVHRGSNRGCQHREWFNWTGGGGTLSRLTVTCPTCGAELNVGQAYQTDLRCSGRFPEREPLDSAPIRSQCTEKARMVQRGAANLRLPELRTLFTVETSSSLSLVVERRDVQERLRHSLDMLQTFGITDEEGMRRGLATTLDGLTAERRISVSERLDLERSGWDEIRTALPNPSAAVPKDFHDLLAVEFNALLYAAQHGAPPMHSPPPRSTLIFEMDPTQSSLHNWSPRVNLRVTPIQRLRTVTVQVGYRRVISGLDAELVDIGVSHQNDVWYPGVDFLGEGLFITLDSDTSEDHLQGDGMGRATTSWREVFSDQTPYADKQMLFRSVQHRVELHPAFVWWHTLAHVLIRSLAVEAGYSAASIRERVYLEPGRSTRGGIVLYATQPGSEGTMGGIVALGGSAFDRILDRARETVMACSNDPVCRETEFHSGHYSGAACYACAVLPETSCEHRNLWLDRNVLLETL